MGFSLISECWGNNFNSDNIEKRKIKELKNKRIVPDNAYNINENKFEIINENKYKFKRNMNRLSNRNGPATRLPKKSEIKLLKKKSVIKEDNSELEIDGIDYGEDLALIESEIESEMETFIDRKKLSQYVKYLEKQNKVLKSVLKKKIHQLKVLMNGGYKDNIFDIILYIISGIFIIYVLHTIVQLVKK